MLTFKGFLIENKQVDERFLDTLPLPKKIRNSIRDNVNKSTYNRAISLYKHLINDGISTWVAAMRSAKSHDIDPKEFYRLLRKNALL